jgi:chromosome partitioning protein
MTRSKVEIPELLGVAEIADLLSVSKQAVSNWRGREKGFPDPIAELKSGPVWAYSSIAEWARHKGIKLEPRNLERDHEVTDRTRECITVSLVNMKGGVGKSTLTANLGWHYAFTVGLKVLAIDLDPQFNLSQYLLGLERYKHVLEGQVASAYDLFEQATPTLHQKKKTFEAKRAIYEIANWDDGSHLHLLPSRLELAWTLKNPTDKSQLLKLFIDQVRTAYDLILIDCPPTESVLTQAAYQASDFIVVPVKPEYLSTIGLPLLADSLDQFKTSHPDSNVKIAGIVFNAVNTGKSENRLAMNDVKKVASDHDWYVFKTMISASDSYPRGARSGKAISRTDYARTDKILEFSEFSEELSKRIGL